MIYTESKKYKITLATSCGLFSFAFLLFFQPFGVNNYRPDEKIGLILIIALLILSSLVFFSILACELFLRPITYKLSPQLPFVFWVMLELTFTCSVTFMVYNVLGEFHDFHLISYIKHLMEFSLVLIFPLVATLFYFKYNSVLKEYMEVQSLSKETDAMQEIILLSGDNKNDKIALKLSSLVLLESEDNYVNLNYLESDQLKKYLIRTTLSNLEQKLPAGFFHRCSRSVIANLQHLDSFKYHQKKLLLKLNAIQKPILVSKSHQEKILLFLEK